MAAEAYRETASRTLEAQGVDPARGLSAQEARKRLRKHGHNRLETARHRSAWRILADQFKSLIFAILFGAAALSFAFSEIVQGAAILVAVAINAGVGFFTELHATRSMEALREMERISARVRRGGRERDIDAANLVPGDMVLLKAGDIVPADLRLVEAGNLRVNQSTLTGEPVPQGKTTDTLEGDVELAARSNMAYKGTSVGNGSALGVVVATGMETELGRISHLAEEAASEQTPLERRLDRLARRLLLVIVVVAAVTSVIGIVAGRDLFVMVETGVALVVAAVPEGLPIVASVALARGMWRLARRNALIERLSAVETLGATNVICSDKTGTLTENRMTLARIALPGGDVEVPGEDGAAFRREGREVDPSARGPVRRALEVGVLCNAARLGADAGAEGDGKDPPARASGDPMEVALLEGGLRAGLSREELTGTWPELRREDFDPAVKMMATFHEAGDEVRVTVKGAPEAVIEASSHVLDGDARRPLDDAGRKAWLTRNEETAAEGLRALALAEKTVPGPDGDPYDGLTLVGLVGLLDPPRAEVRKAVEECREAGIHAVMVTGDQPSTARAIAHAVGLVDDGDKADVMPGSDMKPAGALSESDRRRILETAIFARFDPGQKLDLIQVYQDAGRVVAMTGDGVNDAPALKKADIGVAMGRRGTEVAREAADMVLRDDSFASIVEAIRQGRTIFGNIRKFVIYMLSGNTGEIFAVSLVALLNAPLPLLPLQILYINIISDVFPALALGVGGDRTDVMSRPPRDPREPILTRAHWGVIGGYGAVIGLSALAVFWMAFRLGLGASEAVTISFLTFAFARLWHVFNMRDARSPVLRNEVTTNVFVWIALTIGTALTLAAAWLPGLGAVLGTVPPSAEGWALIAAGSLAPLVVGQLAKLAPFRRFRPAPEDG
ncbi:cation-transporting P-type ATPase [Roseibacterium sp. SDUM158017]|uniref:cation-translocating P-type ATPase n=1 Tax=Roseicyclus salinarum TaxID=3036773 RepID=UPI0024155D3D|nr:cation-transporting P-type ATPase [Roseibacterium sp. SDUM158017]MDG4647829.1 cation-transporting P-type ATPase [Roseibacterium sp. SDUM158017]